MAITLTTTPAANVAAYAPVTVAGTTTRNPFTAGLRHSASLIAADNSGGFLRFTVSSTTFWIAGDTITLTGCSNAALNGRHQITSFISPNTIITSTAYTAAGSGGTVTRMNEGLNIKMLVKNESAATIATLYAPVNPATGAFSIDISKALQYELYSTFNTTPGEVSTRGAYHTYTVYLYESFLNKAYAQTEISIRNFSTTAHRFTVKPVDDLYAFKLQTGNFFFERTVLINFYTEIADAFFLKQVDPEGTVVTSGRLTGSSGHFAYVFETTADWHKVTIVDGTNEHVSNTIVVRKIGACSTLLYFLNRYGAYEAFEFHDYNDEQKTIKVDKYTGETWKERRLIGKQYVNGVYQNIRDLITSPEVYDEDFVPVRVLTDSLQYKAQEVNPEIVIRYDETHIQ